jgi:hypothetical protein
VTVISSLCAPGSRNIVARRLFMDSVAAFTPADISGVSSCGSSKRRIEAMIWRGVTRTAGRPSSSEAVPSTESISSIGLPIISSNAPACAVAANRNVSLPPSFVSTRSIHGEPLDRPVVTIVPRVVIVRPTKRCGSARMSASGISADPSETSGPLGPAPGAQPIKTSAAAKRPRTTGRTKI